KRLFAHPIACDEKALAALVPQREREHPVQAPDQFVAMIFVKMDDDFGVGMRAELMASREEPLAQFLEVVNLAVEDHPDRAVFVDDRLTARGQINDREPPHSQRDVLFEIEAFVVGPAVNDRRRHRARSPFISRLRSIKPVLVKIDKSENPAHLKKVVTYVSREVFSRPAPPSAVPDAAWVPASRARSKSRASRTA